MFSFALTCVQRHECRFNVTLRLFMNVARCSARTCALPRKTIRALQFDPCGGAGYQRARAGETQCPTTRSATCSASPPSARATGPRSAAWSTAARRGIPLTAADIQPWLDQRRPGQSRFTTQRREPDAVQILSGVFPDESGRTVTTGTPIALLIDNVDQRSKDYAEIKDTYRPGHADYTYDVKVRHPRLSRRRAAVGARDRGARRRRRDRAQDRARHDGARRAGPDRAAQDRPRALGLGRTSQTTRSSAPTPAAHDCSSDYPRRRAQGRLLGRRGDRGRGRGRARRASARRSTASSMPISPPR